MMFGWSKKEKLQKFLDSLTPEQKKKLKEHLKTHCIHGVPFDRDIPCLKCMSSGNLSDILPFLD